MRSARFLIAVALAAEVRQTSESRGLGFSATDARSVRGDAIFDHLPDSGHPKVTKVSNKAKVNVGPLDRWLLRANVHSQHSTSEDGQLRKEEKERDIAKEREVICQTGTDGHVAVGNEYAADAKRNAQCAHAKASCNEVPRGREAEREERAVERRREGEFEKRTERSVESARGGGGLDGQLSQLLLNAAREGKVEVVRRILQSHEIPPDAPLLTDSAHPVTLLEGTTAWWKQK
jgi:hypothetical protein